jgi:hypothetical protein
MDNLWDARLATRVPATVDLDGFDDRLFDALQAQPGVDLWTVEVDPATRDIAAHFGLAIAAQLTYPEDVSAAAVVFAHACVAAGWPPETGADPRTEGIPAHHTELAVEYAGHREETPLVYAR